MPETSRSSSSSQSFFGFFGRRLLTSLAILFIAGLLFFMFMDLAPGDFFSEYEMDPKISKTTLQYYRTEFGLDQPFFVQYALWIKNVVTKGDLGMSFSYHQPIGAIVGPRLLNTLFMNLLSLIVGLLIMYPISFYFAYRPPLWLDKFVDIFGLFVYAIPGFFLALLGIIFAYHSHWFPINGATSSNYEDLAPLAQFGDRLYHLALPTILGVLGGLAGSIRSMKALLHNEFAKPYISASRLRGLRGGSIIRHSFRNASVPFISGIPDMIAGLFSGSLFFEIIFGYPGLGKLMYDAMLRQDYYLVVANLIVISTLILILNMISDIILALVDPRVRMR